MTARETLLTVFAGKRLDNVPVSIRLDLWYKDAVLKNSLPQDLNGKTLQDIEGYLGFVQTARFRDFFRIQFEGAKVNRLSTDEYIREEIIVSGKKLTKISKFSNEMKATGMLPHVVKYPIETENDYRLLIDLFQNAGIIADQKSYNSFDLAIGDAGFPVLIIGRCPAHKIALEYVGYEKFFFHLYDMPELLNKFISALEGIYRRDLWPEISASSATAVLHGSHFSSDMTSPPIFDKYFKPYFSDFIKEMHADKKFVGFHADAEMEALLSRILELGFNFSDCLATEPLVKTPLAKYYEAWNKKIVLWGGLPSIIFDPSFPFDKFKEHVDKTINIGKKEGALIIGASDNVMPGAEWKRLLYIAEAVKRKG